MKLIATENRLSNLSLGNKGEDDNESFKAKVLLDTSIGSNFLLSQDGKARSILINRMKE